MVRKTTYLTIRYGWSDFYDTVQGPKQKPKEALLDILKELGPVSIPQIKEVLSHDGKSDTRFGLRYCYLYHLLRRLHRSGMIGWGEDDRVFVWANRKAPTRPGT